MGSRRTEVPLTSVVGTVSRSADFDDEFRLVNPGLRERWGQLATAVEGGLDPPPVELIQLGELYFVNDGHHRVSVSRWLGRYSIPARVLQICTIAYAMCCLRSAHLSSKAAERAFLERVPLPNHVRAGLWLDRPADWARLADTAEAWAYRRSLRTCTPVEGAELARSWWDDDVTPMLGKLREAGVGLGLRDVQLYVTALAIRDRLGVVDWPDDLVDHLQRAEQERL
jgi:hypothetical protein